MNRYMLSVLFAFFSMVCSIAIEPPSTGYQPPPFDPNVHNEIFDHLKSLGAPGNLEKRFDSNCLTTDNDAVDFNVYDCPKVKTLDADGTCSRQTLSDGKDGNSCTNYCEVRVYLTYGPEVRTNSRCESSTAPISCTLTRGTTTTVANTYTFNTAIDIGISKKRSILSKRIDMSALKGSFNFGSSYSYTESVAQTVSETITIPAGSNGFITFVPYYVTSCGSLSSARQVRLGKNGCDVRNAKTVPNYCNTMPFTVSEPGTGKQIPAGRYIFVREHQEGTGWAIDPLDQQDSAYQYPGVAIQNGVTHNP